MMGRLVAVAAILLLFGASPLSERVVAADGLVAAIINGAPGRLRIDPAATAMPIITRDWAARAGMKPGLFGMGYAVGPERVHGRSTVARLTIGATTFKRHVAFPSRAFTTAADGVIGPGGLPDPVVRFRLRDPVAGERTIVLPMVDRGGLGAGWGERYARIEVAGLPMRVRFDPHHPRTLATAAAATRIARAHDGALSGDVEQVEIAFGIERPVRGMRLARPLAVGPLAIDALGVRTVDGGSAATIREAGSDPDEIVVSASGKHDPGRDRLSVGADWLSRCSSIVYDAPAKAIRLNCR